MVDDTGIKEEKTEQYAIGIKNYMKDDSDKFFIILQTGCSFMEVVDIYKSFEEAKKEVINCKYKESYSIHSLSHTLPLDFDEIKKEKYPEYPYKHPNVPKDYILISKGLSSELIWVHPSSFLK